MNKYHYHPGNEQRDSRGLFEAALAELVAMTNRHFQKYPPTLRASIPAARDDSDVLIMDALHRALALLDIAEQSSAERVANNPDEDGTPS